MGINLLHELELILLFSSMEHANTVYLEKSLPSVDRRHLSTVQITEYPDSGLANPEPCSDTQEDALDDFLSPQFLVSCNECMMSPRHIMHECD